MESIFLDRVNHIVLDHGFQHLPAEVQEKKLAEAAEQKRQEQQAHRVYLEVSFAKKDEAKRLGARWNPEARRWWCAPSNKQAIKVFGSSSSPAIPT